jgi:hypothetical protein
MVCSHCVNHLNGGILDSLVLGWSNPYNRPGLVKSPVKSTPFRILWRKILCLVKIPPCIYHRTENPSLRKQVLKYDTRSTSHMWQCPCRLPYTKVLIWFVLTKTINAGRGVPQNLCHPPLHLAPHADYIAVTCKSRYTYTKASCHLVNSCFLIISLSHKAWINRLNLC